jgi:hypothetical protein
LISDPEFLAQVHGKKAGISTQLKALQERHSCIKEVRGAGLLLGMEMDGGADFVKTQCFKKGFIINAIQDKILRFAPPLIVETADIDRLVSVLDSLLLKKEKLVLKKDLLSLLDLEKADFDHLFDRALQLKKRYARGIQDKMLTGKTLGLIFDKKSTRTRIAFETAMIQLGGHPIYMSTQDTQISRNEPAADTARVLSRYIDCLAMRTFDHALVEEFAGASSIPVINALTDSFHPCQILSDIMTIIEHKGGYQNVKIAWVGDGNNVANSWVNAASVLGLNLTVACP